MYPLKEKNLNDFKEDTMNAKKMLWVAVTFLCFLMLAHVTWAQGKNPGESEAQPSQARVTMTARIIPDTTSGGYKAISIKPHEEYKIANADEKILSELARKGEPVTLEATRPKGSLYFLNIEKINGKAYPGKN